MPPILLVATLHGSVLLLYKRIGVYLLKLSLYGKDSYSNVSANILTINVPLFKKLRDIIFFGGENHFMSHFEGHFEGAKTFLTP